MNSIPALMEIEKYISLTDTERILEGKVIINLNLVLNIYRHRDIGGFYCVQMISSDVFYITAQARNDIFKSFKIHQDWFSSKGVTI